MAFTDPDKQPTNVSLSLSLLSEARALGIGISEACERGLAQEVAEARARRWREDNDGAIRTSNTYVEEKGLPLGRHRHF